MKKLMIAAAIVCAAAFAQAGQYNWGCASYMYTDHEGNDLTTGTAFLYLGTVTASDSAFNLAGATYVDIGGFDSTEWVWGKPGTDPLQSSNLITGTSGIDYSIIITEKEVSSLADYEGYYTIVTGTSQEGVLPGTVVTKYAKLVDEVNPIATTSHMSAVPEPTSGLLLLLGVAGLALRRRRA